MIYASEDSGTYNNRSLVGFKRITLEPGQTKSITMDIDLMDMHQWDAENHRYFVEKGNYKLELLPGGKTVINCTVRVQ